MDSAKEQKNKLSKELSEIHLKNKHLLKQMKQLLEQSNEFSTEIMKITEDIRNKIKKSNLLGEEANQSPFENISFNLIDSHYLEFDKINHLSQISDLKKLIGLLLKEKEIPMDLQKTIQENEYFRKRVFELECFVEEISTQAQVEEEFVEKIKKKFIEVIFLILFFKMIL